jgi:hypothetical protein
VRFDIPETSAFSGHVAACCSRTARFETLGEALQVFMMRARHTAFKQFSVKFRDHGWPGVCELAWVLQVVHTSGVGAWTVPTNTPPPGMLHPRRCAAGIDAAITVKAGTGCCA